MPLKSIAVFMDLSSAGLSRARYAVKLALHHNAHLIGIFVAGSGWGTSSSESFARGHDAIDALIKRHARQERATASAANKTFQSATAREEISFEFRILPESGADKQAVLHSLYTDLVIVGSPSPGGLPNGMAADTLLLATAVPCLLIPAEWKGESQIERVLVGWNASREARRAISDSLPFLINARLVSVAVVDAAKTDRHGEEPGADAALYLSRHGVPVVVEQLESNGMSIEDVLLEYSARNNIDLIVLGAYSHARPTQLVFGGVTRNILRRSKVALLIAR